MADRWRNAFRGRPRRLWVTLCDHFEPYCCNTDDELARRRVELWRGRWPEIAGRHKDASGASPRYTFFYPQEEYRPHLLQPLAEMTAMGIADVEVHIHHDGEGERDFLDRMQLFLRQLSEGHGLLRQSGGRLVFGFIHGNWALDNSLPGGKGCGLNNELTLLRELGCYADFTMPSAPSPSQARMVNRIYWARDVVDEPKSYDSGIEVKPGGGVEGDILMVPGPLGVRWTERLIPRLEVGEFAGYDLASRNRIRRWFSLAPRIGEDAIVKLHMHGTEERNSGPMLGGGLDQLFELLGEECGRAGVALQYASAWELFQVIEALRERRDPLAALGRRQEQPA